MSGRKKRIPMMLATVILSLFLAVFPAFSAFAFYYYPISSDGKTQYKVKVKIETTSAAGGWNKAYVEFYTKGQNGQDDESEKDMTCSISDVDDKGDVCNLSGDFEGFPSRIRVYSDFGGGMTWRSWEADVTVYVNNVNVTSKHIYASSSPFSSSDCYNTISIDETKYPYPSSIKFHAPEQVDSDEGEVNTLVSAVIKDQYGVVWTADNPSLTDQDTDYKTMPISAGTYAWEVSCKGPVDRKVIYTLKVPTGNTLKGTVEKTFNIDFVKMMNRINRRKDKKSETAEAAKAEKKL